MSYHIYTTPGIILSHWPLREADRIYAILTRDFGLVRASASGVRKESSKLRGALEPLSLSSISLVRGKEHWRITSAVLESKIPSVFAAPFSLLEKLVTGESPNPKLFDSVNALIRSAQLPDDMFEPRLVSKILFHLGYLREEDLSLSKKDLIRAINKGLQASDLTT
ncbi:MAG: recombination protein O N-terminal domain-containing protein [Patescibacteria group bacterium]